MRTSAQKPGRFFPRAAHALLEELPPRSPSNHCWLPTVVTLQPEPGGGGYGSSGKHQRLKHAAACCSTCFWGQLVGVLKRAAACRGTKLGWDFLGRKYRIKISMRTARPPSGGGLGASGPKSHWGMHLLDKIMILQRFKLTIQPLGVGYANSPKKAKMGGYVAFSPIYASLALI